MRKWKFIILMFFCFSCNQENCPKKHFLDYKFRYSLSIVEISEKGSSVFTVDKRDAILFLETVTGHQSQMEDLEHALYIDKSLYSYDKTKWKEWYTNHRCSLSGHEIDSLLLAYKSHFD